jgi:Na+/proline symporter
MTSEYIVIVCYLCFLFSLGLVFRKFNSGSADYFKSGCRGVWWLVGVSVFVAGVSSRTFTANAGVAYDAGFSIWLVYLGGITGGLAEIFYFAPRFRQMRATTFPEAIEMRYHARLQQIFAYLGIFGGLIGASLILWSLGVFCSAVFGLPLEGMIIGLGLVVVFYSLSGGRWAVMATDFLQALIMIPIAILLTWLCYDRVGGWSGFVEKASAMNLMEQFAFVKTGPGDFWLMGDYGWTWAAAMFITMAFGTISFGAAVRYFSVKDGREARKAAILSISLAAVGIAFWLFPPMVARVLFPGAVEGTGLANYEEASYAVVAMQMLPNGLLGLMVVAMFAAAMSTMDTALNANAAIVTIDVIPAIRRKLGLTPISDKGGLRIGQIFPLIFGIITILTALFFSSLRDFNIFTLMMMTTALLHVPLLIPNVMGVLIKRAPLWAAYSGIAFALASELVCRFAFEEPLPVHVRLLANFLVGVAGFLISMPFWRFERQDFKDHVERFFTKMNTPVDFEKEIGGGVDTAQLSILGKFSIGLGCFICLLLLVPNSLGDRMQVVFLGGFSIVIGSLMLLRGKQLARRQRKGQR